MHTAPGTPSAAVSLRTAQFRRYAKAMKLVSDSEIAAHLGLSRTTVFRMLRGDVAPGERIIAAILAAFPDRRFEDLFEITLKDAA
jgi:predicted DNA-binding transcriptional regulator AlpA